MCCLATNNWLGAGSLLYWVILNIIIFNFSDEDDGLFSALLLPPYYSHIQKKYWRVEFFGHWKFRKLPFFMVAGPTLFIVFYGSIKLFSGILKRKSRLPQLSDSILVPFAVHSLLLSFLSLTIYNVEVCTRLIYSSSPFIYIIIARIILDRTTNIITPKNYFINGIFSFFPLLSLYNGFLNVTFVLLTYLLGYCFIGIIMHVKWLPYI